LKPGLLVLEADAMSTAPRRQGIFSKILQINITDEVEIQD
jgi:hypothetical protein